MNNLIKIAMRKIFFSVLLLTSISGFAAPVITISTDIEIVQEKQYKKINVSDVDKAALEKINKNYGTYTIKEAYKADDGEYKLVLNKDGVDLTATFTSAGDLIKIL